MYDKGFYKRSRGFCVGVCNVSVWVTMWDSLRATKSYPIRLPLRVTCSKGYSNHYPVPQELQLRRSPKMEIGPKIKSITAQPEERRLDSL